jgi:hypothetical protein
MNYIQLAQAIQDYAENTESLFVVNIPTFIQEAEKRIYNSVQLPSLRKNVTGTLTTANQYLSLPNDWLSNYSLAVIDGTGKYSYLLNKDVNFLRESYPNPSVTGLPKYYAVFGSQYNLENELSLIVAPAPSSNYAVELNYFYYPLSIVQGQITGFSSIVAGIEYENNIYYNVPLTGGSGTGASATVTVFQNGVTNVTVENPGSLYVQGEVLTADASYLGGSGSGFTATVDVVLNPAGTSWLGDNYDPVLFYGAMREAIIFMKGEQDMVTYYEKMFQEAMSQLNRLGTGLERGDAYRDGQAKIKVNP